MGVDWKLEFEIKSKCSTTNARSSVMKLHHGNVPTPIFMPVGTRGTIKGLTADQVAAIGVPIILGNTYHLGSKPGCEILKKAGGLHKFMNWNGCLLTDSGGFQMVSLSKLSQVTEEGVEFEHPSDGAKMMLTPEQSMSIQQSINSDVVMQLDDVVSSLTTGPRVEQAMKRSIRWLDRAIECFPSNTDQNLFAIIQGGLDSDLRAECLEEMSKRNVGGFAIGGLSGGEEKQTFWRVVKQCAESLPPNKPRYVMGVGYSAELVVCSALGCDMFDCVYPTRTARFGTALTFSDGNLRLKNIEFKNDHRSIEHDCSCFTCTNYSRAYLNHQMNFNNSALSLITIHNIFYQHRLMGQIRDSIEKDTFPTYVRQFMVNYFPDGIPKWIVDALLSVNIDLTNV